MLKKLFPLFLFLIGVGLWMASCSTLPTRPEPQPSPPPSPESPPPSLPPAPPHSQVRTFPDLIALISRPGDTLSSLAARYLNDPSMDWLIAEFNGITTLTPGQEVVIPLYPFGRGGLTLKGYQMVPILSYHKFSKDRADLLTVTESAFSEQMKFLQENGYRVITLDQFFDFLDFKKPLPPKSVVITIDDNWNSVYEIAFPILKKFGYPATLFVYTDLILPGRNMLSWDRLIEMSQNGIDIQCHTKTHRNLNKRNGQESFKEYFEALKKEVTESADILRKRLNKDIKYLAYPYGETNPLVIALLMKLGYRGALTVDRESNPFFVHPYRVNRSMIYGTLNLKEFEKNLTSFQDGGFR